LEAAFRESHLNRTMILYYNYFGTQ
jgi:hypothetical protein